MPSKTKNTKSEQQAENAAKAKTLSGKRLAEVEHLEGKHKAEGATAVGVMAMQNPECGFCQRRPAKMEKKTQATKRFLAANKSK